MSDEKVEAIGKDEAKDADGKPLFLPTRYIHREAEALAVRVESQEKADEYGCKVGDWRVTDDLGYVKYLSNEEFNRYYQEYEGASWPGKIALQLSGNLTAHGCKAQMLEDRDGSIAEAINAWAESKENFGKLISQIHYFDEYSAIIFYTNTLSDRERDEAQEISSYMREEIDKRHRAALQEQEENLSEAMKGAREADEKKAAYQKELEELAIEGRKHRANCGKKTKGRK